MSFRLTNELFQSARTVVRTGQIKRSLEVKVTDTGAVTDASDQPLDILPLGNQGDHCVTEINFHLPTELQDGYFGYFLVDLEDEIYIQKCEMITESSGKIANAWIEEKITFNRNKELNCLFVAIEADLDAGDNITEETEIFVTDEFYGSVQDNFLTSGWHTGLVASDDVISGEHNVVDGTPAQEQPTEYAPMTWVDGESRLNAANMNNIMLGIGEAFEKADNAFEAAESRPRTYIIDADLVKTDIVLPEIGGERRGTVTLVKADGSTEDYTQHVIDDDYAWQNNVLIANGSFKWSDSRIWIDGWIKYLVVKSQPLYAGTSELYYDYTLYAINYIKFRDIIKVEQNEYLDRYVSEKYNTGIAVIPSDKTIINGQGTGYLKYMDSVDTNKLSVHDSYFWTHYDEQSGSTWVEEAKVYYLPDFTYNAETSPYAKIHNGTQDVIKDASNTIATEGYVNNQLALKTDKEGCLPYITVNNQDKVKDFLINNPTANVSPFVMYMQGPGYFYAQLAYFNNVITFRLIEVSGGQQENTNIYGGSISTNIDNITFSDLLDIQYKHTVVYEESTAEYSNLFTAESNFTTDMQHFYKMGNLIFAHIVLHRNSAVSSTSIVKVGSLSKHAQHQHLFVATCYNGTSANSDAAILDTNGDLSVRMTSTTSASTYKWDLCFFFAENN